MPAKTELVLPGLFDLPQAEFEPGWLTRNLPQLNRLLRFADRRDNRAFSVDAILRRALAAGSETDAEDSRQGLPLAQAVAAAPQAAEAARLVLFKAVYLQAGLHNALLVPIPENDENSQDIHIIINDLSKLFKVDCDISVVTGDLFLMRLKAFDAPTHYPHILSALGMPANPYIEQSRHILPWYRLQNEMQMFMHQHAVNQRRLQLGKQPINSIWCYGAGAPGAAPQPAPGWYCDDALLNRYAQSLGLQPAGLAQIDSAAAYGDAVVVDLRLLETLKSAGSGRLDRLLLDIETRIVAPLLERVARERGRLRLRAGADLDFEFGPFSALKPWRRARTLADWSGADPRP